MALKIHDPEADNQGEHVATGLHKDQSHCSIQMATEEEEQKETNNNLVYSRMKNPRR